MKLRTIRKERGLTLRQVADKVGVSESCISLYESGTRRPNIDTLKKLAEVLRCSIDDLLSE